MYDKNEVAKKYSLFDREYKRIEPYIARRHLTTDLNLRKEYKECLIQTYNDLIDAVDPKLLGLEDKLEVHSKYNDYLKKVKVAFTALKLEYAFDKGVFNRIDIDLITEIEEIDDSFSNENLQQQTPDINNSPNIKNPFSPNFGENSKKSNIDDNFEHLAQQNNNTMATEPQSPSDFIATAHRMINYKYAGDPLALDSFIDAIELLKLLCERENNTIFVKFVMTRLEGLAREAIITETATVDDIITQLKTGIKTESSKVIEGRILALRADNTSLVKFAEQAEKLADQFRRSLCLEGFSREKAKELAIDKTREMCRKSAKNDTVKAVLAASSFSEPKEVIAKMIIEINNLKQDRPQTQYTHKFGNNNKRPGNFNKNFKNNNNNGNNFQNKNGNQSNFQSRKWHNGNGQNNGNHSNNYQGKKGQNNGNQNWRGNNNNNGNYGRSNDQPVRAFSGNETNPGNGGLQMDQ